MGKNNTQLHPNKEYTIQDIVRGGFFPFAKDFRTVRKVVLADLKGDRVLGANVSEGARRTFKIKGSAIIKFNKRYAPGMMLLARKPKTTHGNTTSGKKGSA